MVSDEDFLRYNTSRTAFGKIPLKNFLEDYQKDMVGLACSTCGKIIGSLMLPNNFKVDEFVDFLAQKKLLSLCPEHSVSTISLKYTYEKIKDIEKHQEE